MFLHKKLNIGLRIGGLHEILLREINFYYKSEVYTTSSYEIV